MRDYRDAKIMAHTLREELAAKLHKITVGESLEIIAHLFGAKDWNALSATIKNSDADQKSMDRRPKHGSVQFAVTTETALYRSLVAARGQTIATVEHLLLSLTEDPDVISIMKTCNVDPTAMRKLLARSMEPQTPLGDGDYDGPTPSAKFQSVVQRAILDVQALGGGSVTGANLLVAILTEEESASDRLLREHGITLAAVRKIMGRSAG